MAQGIKQGGGTNDRGCRKNLETGKNKLGKGGKRDKLNGFLNKDINKKGDCENEILKGSRKIEEIKEGVAKGKKRNRKRKREIVYFNPPFNCDVRTNIGKLFFEALDKNFPVNHKYHRWINRHTVKLAYSTVPNFGRIIAGINGKKSREELGIGVGREITDDSNGRVERNEERNRGETERSEIEFGRNMGGDGGSLEEVQRVRTRRPITRSEQTNTQDDVERGGGMGLEVGRNQQPHNANDTTGGRLERVNVVRDGPKLCNCREKKNCPLNNRCLLDNIVYEAKVQTESKIFRYIGCTGNTFKKRWSNHLHSFKNPGMRNITSLARTIHDLKNRKIKYNIDWRVIRRARAYTGGGGIAIYAWPKHLQYYREMGNS